jgi:formiminoglutamase
MMTINEDLLWPRASNWIKPAALAEVDTDSIDLALFGVPAHKTSISATGANHTPAAIRQAFSRYSLNSTHGNLEALQARDFGDVEDPDQNEAATTALTVEALNKAKLAVALGGDNSITFAVARALLNSEGGCGLITFDAHHDIRQGVSNGSPVRRLIEAGLDPTRIVQIGINDFSNSAEYSAQAARWGIRVISRDELAQRKPSDVIAEAVSIAGENIHVDFDVDVCDRAFVPGCPASAPGGISAYELRQFARLVTAHPSVRSIDITEIDARADAPDQRTIRLGALVVLEAAAGLLSRLAIS